MSFRCDLCRVTFNSEKIYENHLKYSPRHQSSQQQVPANTLQPRHPRKATTSSPTNSQKMVQNEKSNWSIVPLSDSQAVLEALTVHVHSEETLRESNYITRPFDPEDYVGRRKCGNCKRKEKDAVERECCFYPKQLARADPKDPGGVRLWLCCGTTSGSEGCQKEAEHKLQHGIQYTCHQDFLRTPPASFKSRKFQAVVLDCEMAGVASGAGEAILLVVTDYVSGAVIINKYVSPPKAITAMRSNIHGVSRKTLNTAIRNNEALDGWKGARIELLKYIDDKTILIGHALENDLNALRLIHPRIVDSGILAKKTVDVSWRRSWGLRVLCEELLEVGFRMNKGGIHDCLEDVLATREVVLFCTREQEAFRDWARKKNIEETEKREEEKKRNEEAREKKKMMEEEKKAEEARKKEARAVDTFVQRAELSG